MDRTACGALFLRPAKFAPFALLLVLVVALGSPGAGAQTAVPETPAADDEAVALLQRAAEVMGDVGSFHFVLRTERGATAIQGLEVEAFEGDVQRPDRFRAEVTASFAGVEVDAQVVGIGSRIWLSSSLLGADQYQELDAGDEAIAALNPDTLLQAAVDAIREPRIVGEDEVDGEPATLVAGLLDLGQAAVGTPPAGAPTLPDGPSAPLPVQIWIDEAGRVVRLRLEGPLSDAEATNVVRRLEFSAFDEPVDIQPPAGDPAVDPTPTG